MANNVIATNWGWECSQCLRDFAWIEEIPAEVDIEYESKIEVTTLGDTNRQFLVGEKQTVLLCETCAP